MTGRQLLWWFAALAVLAGSGLQVARVTQQVRELHADLEAAQAAHDEALARHSRLLLERSALAAYQKVEQLAEERLAMTFPDRVEEVAP